MGRRPLHPLPSLMGLARLHPAHRSFRPPGTRRLISGVMASSTRPLHPILRLPSEEVPRLLSAPTQIFISPVRQASQGASVQAPSGTPGQSVNITVSNANGLGTLDNAVTYIPSTTILPASGILQLLFDTHRNLLYAMKAQEIDVLNPSTLQWQSPLPLPSSATALKFGYMALSPDGTQMVIATTSQKVVVLNPDESAQAVIRAQPLGIR